MLTHAHRLPYQYIEIDPYRKPKELMEISPKGLVPAIRHGNWGLHESAIIMEYLEALCTTGSLLPKDPKALAEAKLWSDWANRNIMPAFYKFLQEQDETKRHEFGDALSSLVKSAPSGKLLMHLPRSLSSWPRIWMRRVPFSR